MIGKGLRFVGIWAICAIVACMGGLLPMGAFWLMDTVGTIPYFVLISLPAAVGVYSLCCSSGGSRCSQDKS